MTQSQADIRRSELILVILAAASMLFLRAWLQRHFLETGMAASLAKDLSFLVAVPTFFIVASPVLFRQRALLASILRWQDSSWGMVWRGIVIGILCRILWWAAVTLRGALGLGEAIGAYPDLLWTFACPPAGILLTGIFVMAVVTPLFEEIAHRGLIQTYFERHGVLIGIVLSAFIFMLFHMPTINPTVFLMGIVLAIQFHLTRSLWMPVATHATFNGLIQLDWKCLRIVWHPPPEQLPLWDVTLAAFAVMAAALGGLFWLLFRERKRR